MKNIQIRFKFPSNSELRNEMQSAMKAMEKYSQFDLKLDTTSFNKSLKEMSSTLNSLKSQLSKFGVLDNISEDNLKISNTKKEVNDLANAIGKLNEKSQIKIKANDRTSELKQSQAINKALEEQYQTQQKAMTSLQNLKSQMQSKLNIASSNNLIDESVITNLQSRINGLNTDSPQREFEELKQTINSLSSSDSSIVRLQNAISKLQERINNVSKNNKMDIINSSEINELKQAENEVANLKSMLSNLKSGDIIDGKKISSSINTATNSVKTLENSFRSVNTTASGLATTMKSIFSYAIGGSAIYAVMNSLREAFSTTVELDTAMRDLKRVTDETEATYSNFMKTANETAIALGSTTKGAIEATTRFSQLGYSFDEASESLSKYALVLSNVANMSASDSSSAIVSVLKGFKLETEDVGDIVDVINEAGNKFALDSNSLAEGLRIGSANLSIAGNDLYEASSMIIAGTEILQDSNTVSNGLKTISMRLRGITEDGEELDAKLGDLVKNLTGVDLTDANGEFRSTYDVLVDISKVFDTLSSKEQALLLEKVAGKHRANVLSSILQNADQLENAYNTLSESAGSASKEQEAYMDSLEGRINALKESLVGISTEMIDSDFMKSFVDGITVGVSSLDSLINKFGALPTTLGIVTASLVAFNSKFRESANTMLQAIPGFGRLTTSINGYSDKLKLNIESIKSQINALKLKQTATINAGKSTTVLGRQMLGLNTNLALTTTTMVAMNVVSVALSATLSALGGMLIGAVVSGIIKLTDSVITTKEELNEMKDSFSTTFNETSNLDTLVQKQKDLQEQLKDTTLTADQQKTKKEELVGVQKQLAELLPETATGFDEEGNNISEDTDMIQENIDKKKELLAMEAMDIAKETNNGEWNHLLNNYDNQIKKVKELQDIYDDAPNPINLENLTEAEGKLDSYKEQLKQLSEMMSSWKDAGFSDSDISEMLLGDIYDDSKYEQQLQIVAYQELKKMVDEYTNSLAENTKAKEDNSNAGGNGLDANTSEAQSNVEALQKTYELLGYSVDDVKDKIEELNGMSLEDQSSQIVKDATKSYGEAISGAKELDSLMEKLNETTSMTPELIMELASKYPELGSRITDVTSVQQFLNDKMNEQVQAQVQAYSIMIENDQEYYNSKISNNEEIIRSVETLCASFVDSQGNAYKIDLSNYTSLAQVKNKLTQDLGSGVADFISNFVTGQSQGYSVDLSNTASWASSKAKIISDLNNQISKLQNNMEKAMSYIKSSSYTGMTAGDADMEKLYMISKNQSDAAKAKLEAIQTSFSTYNPGFSGYKPSFGSGSFSGSGGSGGSGSGSSSASNEIANMEDLTERYHDLEDAINDVNNKLELNKILQNTASGRNKIKLMKEEIELYKKQQQAIKDLISEQKKEAQSLKDNLSNQGVSFDSNGDISNYNQILQSKVNWANSLSGDSKSNAIEQVKNLQEQMKAYDELVNKTIPKQEQEWESLNATIKDVYKTQADLVASMEKDISDVIEYELKKRYDKKKEALNKEKELYNKEYEEDNFEEEMNTERNKLSEIQSEIDKVKNDTSRAGQLRLKQLMAEYEAQQKIINDKIKDQQNQAINDRFDQEEELLDKELEDMTSSENLSKLVAEAISSGMIKIGNETINVQNSMNEMLKETEVGFTNVALQQSEWINNLEQIKSLYGSINSIMSNIGLSGLSAYSIGDVSRSNGVGDINVTTGGITIQGNADNSTLSEVKNMLDVQAKEIYKNITKQLS